MEPNQKQHFLIITYPLQTHINPALNLAKHLAATTGALVTFSTTIFAHHKMFPNLVAPDQEVGDGLITYIPVSDGFESDGERTNSRVGKLDQFLLKFKLSGSQSLHSIIENLKSRGQHVSCIIYTMMIPWAADVAYQHNIASAQFWIQPAITFAIYYHFLHGYDSTLSAHSEDLLSTIKFPGLPELQIRDLPSFIITTSTSLDDTYAAVFSALKEAILNLDREATTRKPKVLVNTFDELETNTLSAMDTIDLIAVGPIIQSVYKDSATVSSFDLIQHDEKGYMEWLDLKPKKSVVYVSFGSLAVIKKQQMEEVLKGLKMSGMPYLWVVRKESRYEEFVLEDGENGMIVEWCSQMRVLTHFSIGCFVTHCGWNSVLESLACGVPIIGFPLWSDQGMNAMLVEKLWGTGMRGEVNEEGVLEARELMRCLDLVVGDGARGVEIRKKAEFWKEKAREAITEGGPSDQNIRVFVDDITKHVQKCD